MLLNSPWRGVIGVACASLIWVACGSGDDDGQVVPDAGPDVEEDVTADAQVDVEPDVEPDVDVDVEPDVEPDADVDVEPDVELDVEPDVEPDVVLGPTQAVGGVTSGASIARSSRFATISSTTGGLIERRSTRFIAVGRVSVPFFGE